LNRCAAA